jgi:hypothetical protein
LDLTKIDENLPLRFFSHIHIFFAENKTVFKVVSLVLLVSSFLLLVVAQFCLSSAIEHKSKTKQKKTSVKMRKVVKLRVCIKIAQYKNGLDKLENRTEQDLFLMCFNPCFLYSNIYIYI